MKKITYILLMTVMGSISISVSVSAQDSEEYSGSGLDASQIQQLACMANDINGQSESSLDNIGSILNETLVVYSEDLSEEELNAARSQANNAVADLDLNLSIQQLCNGSEGS